MWTMLTKAFGSRSGRIQHRGHGTTSRRLRPGFEGLEARDLKAMVAEPIGGGGGGSGSDPVSTTSVGITFENNVITINAPDTGCDAKVERNWDFLVTLKAPNGNIIAQKQISQWAWVDRIVFNGGNGKDRFENCNVGVESTAFGKGGDDTLIGGNWDDRLYGGDGVDTLIGGFGCDRLDGGYDKDKDTLEGGADADTYVQHWWRDSSYTTFIEEENYQGFDKTQGDTLVPEKHSAPAS